MTFWPSLDHATMQPVQALCTWSGRLAAASHSQAVRSSGGTAISPRLCCLNAAGHVRSAGLLTACPGPVRADDPARAQRSRTTPAMPPHVDATAAAAAAYGRLTKTVVGASRPAPPEAGIPAADQRVSGPTSTNRSWLGSMAAGLLFMCLVSVSRQITFHIFTFPASARASHTQAIQAGNQT